MTIRNAGRVLSQWKFIPKEGEQSVCKPWLSFYPTEGVLAPGEEMKITATLCVRPLHVELMRLTHSQSEPLSDDNVSTKSLSSDSRSCGYSHLCVLFNMFV
jgi:hypothetical protein